MKDPVKVCAHDEENQMTCSLRWAPRATTKKYDMHVKPSVYLQVF